MGELLCQLYCILAIRPARVISSLQLSHKRWSTRQQKRAEKILWRGESREEGVWGKGGEERRGEEMINDDCGEDGQGG